MIKMDQDEYKKEQHDRKVIEEKLRIMNEAERQRNDPVDDAKEIAELFQLLDNFPDSASESNAPSAFKV